MMSLNGSQRMAAIALSHCCATEAFAEGIAQHYRVLPTRLLSTGTDAGSQRGNFCAFP